MSESIYQSMEGSASANSGREEDEIHDEVCLICYRFCHRQLIKKNVLQFILKQKPVAKQRHRMGKNGIVFDPQGPEKELARAIFRNEIKRRVNFQMLKGNLSVAMVFYTPIPDFWSEVQKSAAEGNGDPRRPDIDNYVKFYFDVMNGIVYRDDSAITSLLCEKRFSREPKVKITIISDRGDDGSEEVSKPRGRIE